MDLTLIVWSIFIVAFLSNVTPFFGASYTLYATLLFTELGESPLNFLMVVWASALGATLAKVVIYYGAYGLKGYISGNKNVQLIGRNSDRGTFYLALFATALIPVLPLDDFLFIGAGASSSSIGLMSAVTLIAKLLKSAFEVVVVLEILKELGREFHFQRLDVTLVLAAAFLLLGIVFYKLDWRGLYNRLRGRRTSLPETVGPLPVGAGPNASGACL